MQKIKETLHNESGQMVIIVMLVLVIALTIGLSLISRTITNTRLSTNTELANRAYSAAEAGIEKALSGSNDVSGSLSVGSLSTNFTISDSDLGGSTQQFDFPNPVAKDETVQLWLFDYATFSTSSTFSTDTTCSVSPAPEKYFNECDKNRMITVYWGNNNGSNPVTDSNSTPALEVTTLYLDSGSNFKIEKCAYDPNSTRATSNNFLTNAPSTATDNSNFCDQISAGSMQIAGAAGFGNTTKYNFQKKFYLESMQSSSKRYLLMRIKPLYNTEKQRIGVLPNSCITNPAISCTGTSAPLPSQGRIIDSEGTAGDVVRKIRVYQSYPTLPGIFDFVLYNGSNNPLSK